MEDKKATNIGIAFGAISEPLSKQLKTQGFTFDKETVEHYQKDIDAINRLRIRGFLTHSATNNITQKLYKKIVSHVCKQNDLHPIKSTKK